MKPTKKQYGTALDLICGLIPSLTVIGCKEFGMEIDPEDMDFYGQRAPNRKIQQQFARDILYNAQVNGLEDA